MKPQGYRLPPDIVEARRLKKQGQGVGSRPHNPHDAASYDPERTWGEGAQLFKCTRCDEEVVVVPTDPQDRDIP